MDTNGHGLSGKAKLAFEAASKVVRGEQLIKEGKLELANLFPDSDSKTIANRILKDVSPKKSNPVTKSAKPYSTDKEKVLNVIRGSSWLTMSRLMKTTGMGWYFLNKIVRDLANNGVIKSVKKSCNPDHKGTSSYNKEYSYWVIA